MYKTAVRVIHSGNSIYDPINGELLVQNAGETDLYLSEAYPTHKYNLIAVNFLGEVKIGEVVGLRYSWHFVEIAKGK